MRHSTYVEVLLQNISFNVNTVRRMVGKAGLITMVKGNAYGHGIERVSQHLHDMCDIRSFGVASLGEALTIRGSQPSIAESADNEIFIFSDTEILNEGCQSYYKPSGKYTVCLTPIIGTPAQLKAFCTSTVFNKTKLCVKVSTGMNRLGLRPEELQDAVPLLKQRGGVDLLLQHFAVAGSPQCVDGTYAQYEVFKKARQLLVDSGVEVRATSVSNSGAIEQNIGVTETYVRPGIMLYGPHTNAPPSPCDIRPASHFYTKVLHHFPVRRGDPVGYDLVPVEADGVVVLLPIGYADGFLRGYVGMPITVTPVDAVEPITGSVHGRVNMDMTAVVVYPEVVGKDIGSIMAEVKDGARVEVWGGDIDCKAAAVKSIPYELMCEISIRVPRVYKSF
ncbi:alanine racemase [Trypanosoma grayi]|uniref:alanine racemase n=1 Tax=Trypanosoma grayi TaxID=71804 RepID=UPI0004F41AE2|nr:alanine racemase [Trypanosoma grayi]KEG09355.1 alanine racemase [Trypanosoma grayi]